MALYFCIPLQETALVLEASERQRRRTLEPRGCRRGASGVTVWHAVCDRDVRADHQCEFGLT
jgi:hypothetical protein